MKELFSGNGDSADPGGLKLDVACIHAACVAEWSQREFGVSLSHPVESFTGQLLTNGHFFTRPCFSQGPMWVVVSCQVVSNSFLTLWTVARQVLLSVGFPRQEY